MEFTVSSDIAAPPEQVFDRMADARNEVHWNSQVSTSDLTSDEPVRRGSTFRTVNRGKPYDATITTYDRPNVLTFEVTGQQMDITASFRFEPSGSGTKMHETFAFRPKGFLKAMFPLMKPLVRKDLPKQAASFKAFAESP